MSYIKTIFKCFILACVGGVSYIIIEFLYRGYSHWTMFIDSSLKFQGATLTTKPGAVIKNCGIQFTAKDASASVEVVGAWIISDPTGVEKVEVLNAANAEFVNAAGQKVGKNYKGLVINKATGKKYINK